MAEHRRRSKKQGKRPGKTEWAGRRRPATRAAGFRSHPDATGGEFRVVGVGGWQLEKGAALEIEFRLPKTPEGTLLGFGGWYRATRGFVAELEGFAAPHVLTPPADPDWSKFGGQWYSDGGKPDPIVFRVTANAQGYVALYSRTDGIVDWRACLDPAAEHAEIVASHCGMAVSAQAYRAIADALARFRRADRRASAAPSRLHQYRRAA